jgi:Inositol hexakisphosphate
MKADLISKMITLLTRPAANAARSVEVESISRLGKRRAAVAARVPMKVCNPLPGPYPTGSYLIRDIPPRKEKESEHFRNAMTLESHPYRASGSHQLNLQQFRHVLSSHIVAKYRPSIIYLVDLRQETHGFLDDIAHSWYADNDFGNVGQPLDWIVNEEKIRLLFLEALTKARVFEIATDASDNRAQQRMTPTSYRDIAVGTARTEEQAFDDRKIGSPRFYSTVQYVRIPVTDHCAPDQNALKTLEDLARNAPSDAWFHFHCHGGDGRTTTFLMLYDMLCWKKSSKKLPELDVFACRQFGLPPRYCLNPDGCRCGKQTSNPIGGWKRPLALQRWSVLEKFRQRLDGGLIP